MQYINLGDQDTLASHPRMHALDSRIPWWLDMFKHIFFVILQQSLTIADRNMMESFKADQSNWNKEKGDKGKTPPMRADVLHFPVD